jgi:hypothetical protein
MNQKSGAARNLSAHSFTEKQGQYLAFIYTYSHMFWRPPARPTCSVISSYPALGSNAGRQRVV